MQNFSTLKILGYTVFLQLIAYVAKIIIDNYREGDGSEITHNAGLLVTRA